MNNKKTKGSPIVVKIWNTEEDRVMYSAMTLDQIIENPNGINLELLGLHFLNALRIDRGLEPVKHVLSDEARIK